MSALQQGNFCSFEVVNLDRQPVVKIIRQRGVNLVQQEVVFYASFSRQAPSDVLSVYNYTYDNLSRLTSASHTRETTGLFNENLTYDKNGNIMTLIRNSTKGVIDNLIYEYDGNLISRITDNAPLLPYRDSGFVYRVPAYPYDPPYTYDKNGSMTKDYNRSVTIEYNMLNLPKKVTSMLNPGKFMAYSYDAQGRKLQVLTTAPGVPTKTEDYIDNKIYKDGILEKVLVPGGYITFSGSTPNYHYFVTDHLGNVRQVMSSTGIIEEKNDYYPFGLRHNRSNYILTSGNKYKYNGKEQEQIEGLLTLDYGARLYDPAIGRWNVVDPLAEDFPSWAPYHYCHNNPIVLIDPDGQSADWYQSESGALLWQDENKQQITVNGEKFNNVGTSASVSTGDGRYVNYYQNVAVSVSNAPVNSEQTVLNNDGLKGQLLSKGSPLSEKSQTGLMTASIHKGQEDFLNHPVTKATVNTLLFIATGGIEGVVSLASSGSKLLPNIKLLKGQRGEVSGFSISKGGYGAKPRFDVHPLGRASKASNSMPNWTKGKALPHYHRGAGNNLHRHRPWEKGWNDKSFFDRF